jgi:hypothetical protein
LRETKERSKTGQEKQKKEEAITPESWVIILHTVMSWQVEGMEGIAPAAPPPSPKHPRLYLFFFF